MKFLKISSLIIAIFVVILISVILWNSKSTNYEYVQNSSLIIPVISEKTITNDANSSKDNRLKDRKRCIQLLQRNHELTESENLSLIINMLDSGSLSYIDDGHFSRLSISIRNYQINKPISLNDNDVKIYFSDGGAAWVCNCSGWFANEATGSILISQISGNKISAAIDIAGYKTHAYSNAKEQFKFNGKYIFHKNSIKDVNNWAYKWDFLIAP